MFRFFRSLNRHHIIAIVWVAALAVAFAETGARQAAPTRQPASKAAAILTWPPALREQYIAALDKFFLTRTVKAGPKPHVLDRGRPLAAFETGGVRAEYFDTFMTSQQVHGVLVIHDAHVRLERYTSPDSATTRWNSFSVSKSITSTLVGAAMKDGFIHSLDDKVTRYIKSLRGSAYDDVTVRQLLTMTSGVKWNEDYTDMNSDVAKMYAQPADPGFDMTTSYVRKLPREAPPGTKWVYKTSETNLVGVMVAEATGKRLADYLSEKIWRPYGMERDAEWMIDDVGHEQGGCCLAMTLRDYGRFGQFIIDGARIDGTSIVADNWLSEATRSQVSTGANGSGYGYQWWTRDDGTFEGRGIYGQTLHIDPKRRLVIVINSATERPTDQASNRARQDFIAAVKAELDREATPGRFAGTAPAKAEFDKGKALEKSNEWEQAALAYRRAWTIDPEFADAYDAYSWARQRQAMGDITLLGKMSADERKALSARTKAMEDSVMKEYDDLMREHPKAPIYKWAKAQLYNETNIDLQGQLCREATEMDPAFTPGYRCLAIVASVRGDFDVAVSSLRHVMAIDGESPELWLRMARSAREVPKLYKSLTDEVIAHLPNTDTAAQALESWAESLPVTERTAAFERLIAEYPPQTFKATTDGAMWLFTLYDDLAPEKAAGLAHRMAAALPQDKEWQAKVVYADTLADAEKKVAVDGAGALALLKNVKVPTYVSRQRLLLLTAKAQDRAGQLDAAYGDLLKAYAPQPGPKLESALYAYGRRLNKDAPAVDKDVWDLRTSAAKPAVPFALESFLDGKTVSLSDFKGRVVLLDFWFPNCGPCRGSFPLMERLYAKHKAEGLVYLGVKGLENQDPQVMPLWKSLGLSFTPLKSNEKWCADVYNVRGYPSTFFIGADQQTYFTTHVYDETTFAIADMQLTALLKAAKR